jgi:hypothetical protein
LSVLWGFEDLDRVDFRVNLGVAEELPVDREVGGTRKPSQEITDAVGCIAHVGFESVGEQQN